MLNLALLRHADARMAGPSRGDADRPLSPRGIRDATAMGGYLRREALLPDVVLCSTARRAAATWDLLSADWPGGIRVAFDSKLYLTTPAMLLRRLAAISGAADRVMIIGHNPGLQQLAVSLTLGRLDAGTARLRAQFPTAALAMIDLGAGSWQKMEPNSGRLARFVVPGDLA